MKYKDWHVPGYGTENVAPFLSALIGLARPQKVLEIGFGYTTPFLLEGLRNNSKVFFDGNCDKEYFTKPYEPKLVVIDDQSLEADKERSVRRRKFLEDEEMADFIEGDFTDNKIVKKVKREYGEFDFSWFDCGGPKEYEFFKLENFEQIKEYRIFHFTFFRGEENNNGKVLSNYPFRANNFKHVQRLDIIEPHKFKQGSISILKKI